MDMCEHHLIQYADETQLYDEYPPLNQPCQRTKKLTDYVAELNQLYD